MAEEKEMKNVTPIRRPKDLRGNSTYDGTTPLPDQTQEDYINRIIFNLGDRVKSYEEVYFPGKESPKYSPRAPYKFFERRGFLKRYNFLMNRALLSAGIDKRTLLLKTSRMLDLAVANNKVRDFTTLVDTAIKLQETTINKETQNTPMKIVEDDLRVVDDLLEDLN